MTLVSKNKKEDLSMGNKDNDYSYFERNEKGEPIKFVEHHESHSHEGKCPHEHETDMREATIESISKHGNYNDLRKIRE